MIGIVGTVPDQRFPLVHGPARVVGHELKIEGYTVPVNRGTPALISAAATAAEHLGAQDVYAFLIGDIGKGDGSRRLYQFLSDRLREFHFEVLTFHYLQPDADWHNKVLFAMDEMSQRPILIADAGFMYAAKMSGQAARYDFFTPDVGELAFLADETAPHPFYTRGFILHRNEEIPELIERAYNHNNAAVHLLVKSKSDHIAKEKQIVGMVDSPSFDAMEAIGGTGDSLTGLLSAYLGAGLTPLDAAVKAAKTNRWTGHFVPPTPATQIAELIQKIPRAMAEIL